MVNMNSMNNVQTDIKEFNQLHPNRKLAVFGIILFVFILSILVGVYFTRSRTQTGTGTDIAPTGSEVATTTLSLLPSAESVGVGETVTVSVMLDGEAVQATDVVVTFDPKVFKATEVTNGSVFESIVRQELEDGKVSVTSAVSPTATTDLKTGELFSFTLEALAPGSTQLTFDPELTITAKNGINTLQDTQSITVSVQ
jgi:hypothetical protein